MMRILILMSLLGCMSTQVDPPPNTTGNRYDLIQRPPGVTEPGVTASFVPDALHEAGEPQEKTITDPARVGAPDREFFVALRVPIGAPTPWPVIVLSHGGSTGKKNPAAAMER